MKAALIDNQNNVNNVIVWDDTCTAPNGTVAVVVEDDVSVAPGWTYANGTFTPPPKPPLPPKPKYTAFWNALLTSNVYGSIRTQSMTSLPMNTLATEFIALIGDAKAGRPNETAIQSSMSAIFSTGTFTEENVEEFNNLLTTGHLDDIYSLSTPTP
jgi:hypothetical protein